MSRETEIDEVSAPHRIIVTVDVGSCLPYTLELAAALAKAHHGALHGLFVEDEDLLNVAGLPFSLEVPLSCGKPRVLDDRTLERSLGRASREFRSSLESHAENLSLSWSFATVRGRKRSLELGDEECADILVVAQPPSRRTAPRSAVRQILLALDHSTLALPALRVVLQRNPGAPVELLVLEEEGEHFRQAHPDLPLLLEEFPDVKMRAVQASHLELQFEARSGPLDCVLVSRKIEPGLLRSMLALASCPVIIVS